MLAAAAIAWSFAPDAVIPNGEVSMNSRHDAHNYLTPAVDPPEEDLLRNFLHGLCLGVRARHAT